MCLVNVTSAGGVATCEVARKVNVLRASTVMMPAPTNRNECRIASPCVAGRLESDGF
jgi:hypothetical protein